MSPLPPSAPALRLPATARRALAALVAALLVLPLQALLAAPAHAAPVPVAGNVTDTDGLGLSGVEVEAFAPGNHAVVLAAATTLAGVDLGEFELEIEPGDYHVSFRATGFDTQWFGEDEGVPATVTVDAEGNTTVDSGEGPEEVTLDAELVSSAARAVSGTVTGTGGAAAVGILVEAFGENSTTVPMDSEQTNAGGSYTLSLKEGDYTLRFSGTNHDPTTRSITVTRANVVPSTGTSCTPQVCAVQMPAQSGLFIKGSVTDEKDAALPGATVRAYSTAGPLAASATTDAGGRYSVKVPSAGTYHLEFSAAGKATQWLTSFEDDSRTVVTVTANGVVTAPEWMDVTPGIIDEVQLLLPAPTPTVRPSISGKVAVGSRIEVKPGAWVFPGGAAYPFNQADIEDYLTVDWFIDGKPADDWSAGGWFQKYDVPAEAGGRKLSYRLTLDDPTDAAHHTSAVFTSDPIAVPKAKPKLKGTYAKGALRITVTVPELKKPTGKVKVLAGKKTIGKGKVAPAGKGVVVVKVKLAKGKHKLTISYSGTANVASAKKKVTVTV